MQKILITGAGGYIGSVATDLFLAKGFGVIAIDNFSRGFRGPLEYLRGKYGREKLSVHTTDLATGDIEGVLAKEKDIIAAVHFAALCSVDESVKHPELYEKNNVLGSRRLLSAMKNFGVLNIVFSSTCAVYGEVRQMPVREDHPTSPVNPYGESKLKIEKEIIASGLNYVIFRYFNVCGATDEGDLGDSKKPSVHLVQNAVRGALDIEPFFFTCPTVNTPDRTPIRDYVNVVDLNEAHVKAFEYLISGGDSKIINLGTGTGNSVLEIVQKVEEVTGTTLEKKLAEPRQGEYARAIADIELAKSVLDWSPQRSLEQSVRSLVNWYSDHPRGWDL